ncbi:MAG: short-chain dehydrogenase [Planctomyces sp.]|nr:short-chain dehydrogenase [Planctomyces sp.]
MGFSVENRIALVTGANRGIGKVIVETLLAKGAKKVYVGVRKLEAGKELADKYPGKAVPIVIDLNDRTTIKAAAAQAKDVELVVNNAGIALVSKVLDDNAFETLEQQFQVNVYGLLAMAQAFAPILKTNGGGAFAQLNSVVSLKSFGDVGTYSASKAASYSVTQSLREQLAGQGTLVVSVHPGPIATDMAADAGFMEIAEPPSLVAEALVKAVANGEFHVFPDSMARQMWGAYEGFARNVIEPAASH